MQLLRIPKRIPPQRELARTQLQFAVHANKLRVAEEAEAEKVLALSQCPSTPWTLGPGTDLVTRPRLTDQTLNAC